MKKTPIPPTHEAPELWTAVAQAYERHATRASISPSWLATEAMVLIDFPRDLHPVGYIGCHMQMRQIARAFCRKSFDLAAAMAEGDTLAADLFPDTLQDRYPLPHRAHEDPEYRLLGLMSDETILWNADKFQGAGEALIRHGDALRAYVEARHDRTADDD